MPHTHELRHGKRPLAMEAPTGTVGSYFGLRIYVIPDMVWDVAAWKLLAFPVMWHQHLDRQWLPNPDCPADDEFLVNERAGVAHCNVRAFDRLKRHVDSGAPAMRFRS